MAVGGLVEIAGIVERGRLLLASGVCVDAAVDARQRRLEAGLAVPVCGDGIAVLVEDDLAERRRRRAGRAAQWYPIPNLRWDRLPEPDRPLPAGRRMPGRLSSVVSSAALLVEPDLPLSRSWKRNSLSSWNLRICSCICRSWKLISSIRPLSERICSSSCPMRPTSFDWTLSSGGFSGDWLSPVNCAFDNCGKRHGGRRLAETRKGGQGRSFPPRQNVSCHVSCLCIPLSPAAAVKSALRMIAAQFSNWPSKSNGVRSKCDKKEKAARRAAFSS